MTTIPAPDLVNLRTAQHSETLNLNVLRPDTILAARVNNGAIIRGARSIAYDGGSGTYALVRSYQVLWVGTAPGLYDVGRVRIKTIAGSAVSGTITVDENAIPWADDQYLTIKFDYPITNIQPRISGGIFYKHYSTAFPGINAAALPVCIAGPDQAKRLVAGSAVFNFDLTGSYAIADGATITGYSLTAAPSATAAVVNTGVGTYTVTVTTEDYWWITATANDSNGQSQERFVLITTEPPYRDFELSAWSETWGQGMRCSVNVHGDVTLSDFPDGALCLLWYDGSFDGVSGYVNVLASDYDNLLTVGYIRSENSADAQLSSASQEGSHEVTFQITTVDDLLNNVPMMSVTIEAVATPATWYEYARWLTVGRAIHHLLLWHSDVIHRVDYLGGTSNTLRLKEARFEEGTLFQQANRLAFDQGILARLACDRLNRLHLVADSQMLNTAARAALDIVFDIEESDLSGDVAYVRNTEERVYISQLSGFYFDGANSTAYVSLIPGYQETGASFSLPEQRGASSQNRTQQVLASQADSNEKAGRVHAESNRAIQEFRLNFRGNYLGALTTIPSYGWYRLGIDDTDLARELDINNIKLLCRQINLQYQQGHFTVSGVFEPEAQGPDGIPGNYPTTMPSTPVVQPRWEAEAIDALLAFSSASFRDDDDTDWEELQTTSYNHGCIDPWWQVKQRTTDPEDIIWWAVADGKIYRVRGKNGTPDERTPVSAPPNTWSDGTAPAVAGLEFVQVTGDMWRESTFYALARWQEAGGDWRGWLLVTDDDGLTWSYVELYDGGGLPTQVKPVWAAVNGTYILVTVWEDDVSDTLKLLQFDAVTLAYSAEDSLGATTLAELNDRTYYAFPVTVLDDDDLWHVAGRMNAPAGVAGTQHIIKTTNAGAAFSSVDALHTTNHVAALAVGLNSGGNRVYHLLAQAVTAGVPDLSAGTETEVQDDVGSTAWKCYMVRLSDTEMYVYTSGTAEDVVRRLYTVGAGFGSPDTLTNVFDIVLHYAVNSNQVPAGRSALLTYVTDTTTRLNLPTATGSNVLYDLEELEAGVHLASPVFALIGSNSSVRDITVADDYTANPSTYTTYATILPASTLTFRGVYSDLNNTMVALVQEADSDLIACLVTFDGSFVPTLTDSETLTDPPSGAEFVYDFVQISDTEYWIFYRTTTTDDDYSLYMVQLTVSGGALTWGTPVLCYTLAPGGGIARVPNLIIKLTNTRVAYYYQEDDNVTWELKVETIELGVGMDNNAVTIASQGNAFDFIDASTYGRTIARLSNTKLLASWYTDATKRIIREIDIA